MAHKMGAGSTKNTRDSKGQRLGVKFLVINELKVVQLLFDNVVQNLNLES